jgi:hypothetical protein
LEILKKKYEIYFFFLKKKKKKRKSCLPNIAINLRWVKLFALYVKKTKVLTNNSKYKTLKIIFTFMSN